MLYFHECMNNNYYLLLNDEQTTQHLTYFDKKFTFAYIYISMYSKFFFLPC